MRERGVTPERVIGALAASLGLVLPGASIACRELVPRFDLARVPRTAVMLDELLA